MQEATAMRRWLALAALTLVASASVRAVCTKVTASNLDFHQYFGVVNDTTAELTVKCSSGFAYSVTLDGGSSGNVNARTATAGGVDRLRYVVYRDAARTAVWTNVPGSTTIDGVGTGANQVYPVYARIPAGQVVIANQYKDAPVISAGGTSSDIKVTAEVKRSCKISEATLNFGSYVGLTLDAIGTLSVTCTNKTNYSVGLGVGTAPGATVTARRMTSPVGATLDYALFSDSGRTTNWGDNGGSGTLTGTGNGAAQLLTVYGRMGAGQVGLPGAYSDTIIVTLTY